MRNLKIGANFKSSCSLSSFSFLIYRFPRLLGGWVLSLYFELCVLFAEYFVSVVCFLILIFRARPISPTQYATHFLHFSLYTPLLSIFLTLSLLLANCCSLFSLLKATFRLFYFSILPIFSDVFPMYGICMYCGSDSCEMLLSEFGSFLFAFFFLLFIPCLDFYYVSHYTIHPFAQIVRWVFPLYGFLVVHKVFAFSGSLGRKICFHLVFYRGFAFVDDLFDFCRVTIEWVVFYLLEALFCHEGFHFIYVPLWW